MKYKYQGIPLSKYCEKNNIAYETMLQRIHKLQKLNVGISDEEAVRLAIENYVNGNAKYKCQGVSLRIYCENNNINYPTIVQRIHRLQELKPELTIDELVTLALSGSVNTTKRSKYQYNNIRLIDYCRENGLNYCSTIQRISKVKEQNIEISDDSAVKQVVENYINGNVKYKYHGMPLTIYCESNNINYPMILQRIHKFQKLKPELSIDSILELAFSNDFFNDRRRKYQYDGISLSEYCKKNGLNYIQIIQKISCLKKINPEISNDEAVKLVFENYVHRNTRYIYDGVSLKDYCEKNNLNYRVILGKIHRLQGLNVGISDEEVIQLALKNNIHGNTKYKCQGVSLREYCQNNGLNYRSVLIKINNLQKKDPDLSDEEVVTLALIKKYKKNK